MISTKLHKPKPPAIKTNNANNNLRFWKSFPINICYGLQNKEPIPLQNVNINLKVQQGILIVEIQQEYKTQLYDNPIELEYLFITNKNATVTKIVVEIGNEKKYGIIKEKQESQKEYEGGIKQGKSMAYSDQDELMPELKKVRIGSLAPNQNLKITFEYVQPLEVFLNKYWIVEVSPLINPFYLKENTNSKYTTYNQELSEAIKKYVLISKYEFHYKQNFSIIMDMGLDITDFRSPTHQIVNALVKKGITKQQENKKLTLILEDTPENQQPNKQFTLLFTLNDINLPKATLTHTNNDALQYQKYCATLTLIPKFNEITLDEAYQQYLDGGNIVVDQKVLQGEYIFFLDVSSSMQGTRIKKVKEALLLFIKSLPENCYFNVVAIGTNHQSPWNFSQQYSQQSVDEAIKFVTGLSANMGEAEICKPLQEFVYKKLLNKHMMCKQIPLTKNVFILTEGKVDAKPILDLIAQFSRADIKFYSLGFGKTCSQYFIQKVAEVGNGKYHIMSEDDNLSAKIIDLLEDSLTPYLEQFTLETNLINIQSIIPAPDSIVCLKKNQGLMLQILFSKDQLENNLEFTLSCYDPQEYKPLKYTIVLNLEQSQENEYFHKIAAQKFINFVEKSIQDKEKVIAQINFKDAEIKEQELVNISLQYQILSSYTAFSCEAYNQENQFKQQINEKIIVNGSNQNAISQNQNQKNNPSNLVQKQQKSNQQQPIQVQQDKLDKEIIQFQGEKLNEQQQVEQRIHYQQFVLCAKVDGSFVLPSNLQNQMKISQFENNKKLKPLIWQTLLVLFYFELFGKGNQKSWQVLFLKGVQFLQKNQIKYQVEKNALFQKYNENLHN